MEKEFLNGLTEKVIGAALEVHRVPGPGLLESTYESALVCEPGLQGLKVSRKVAIPIRYKGLSVEESYRLDLVIEDTVVVEVKTVAALLPIHSAQLLTYLKMFDKHIGLLINFSTIRLVDGIKRQVPNLPS